MLAFLSFKIIYHNSGEIYIPVLKYLFTGAYLITQKDVFFDRARTCQLICSILAGKDTALRIDLPPPAIFKVCIGSNIEL